MKWVLLFALQNYDFYPGTLHKNKQYFKCLSSDKDILFVVEPEGRQFSMNTKKHRQFREIIVEKLMANMIPSAV